MSQGSTFPNAMDVGDLRTYRGPVELNWWDLPQARDRAPLSLDDLFCDARHVAENHPTERILSVVVPHDTILAHKSGAANSAALLREALIQAPDDAILVAAHTPWVESHDDDSVQFLFAWGDRPDANQPLPTPPPGQPNYWAPVAAPPRRQCGPIIRNAIDAGDFARGWI
ncbi:hypothetical protein FRAHR75_770013 [Frankia sp. Hr75.2]|nr:hypothetical protein FRAHR75_770013 [Frankia sp. Hr75.2]